MKLVLNKTKEEIDKEIEEVRKELAKVPKNVIDFNLTSKLHKLIQYRKSMDLNLYDDYKKYLESKK